MQPRKKKHEAALANPSKREEVKPYRRKDDGKQKSHSVYRFNGVPAVKVQAKYLSGFWAHTSLCIDANGRLFGLNSKQALDNQDAYADDFNAKKTLMGADNVAMFQATQWVRNEPRTKTWITQPYFNGSNINSFIRHKWPISFEEKIQCCIDIAQDLKKLHENNLRHGYLHNGIPTVPVEIYKEDGRYRARLFEFNRSERIKKTSADGKWDISMDIGGLRKVFRNIMNDIPAPEDDPTFDQAKSDALNKMLTEGFPREHGPRINNMIKKLRECLPETVKEPARKRRKLG